jgi:hypothetical protein
VSRHGDDGHLGSRSGVTSLNNGQDSGRRLGDCWHSRAKSQVFASLERSGMSRIRPIG